MPMAKIKVPNVMSKNVFKFCFVSFSLTFWIGLFILRQLSSLQASRLFLVRLRF